MCAPAPTKLIQLVSKLNGDPTICNKSSNEEAPPSQEFETLLLLRDVLSGNKAKKAGEQAAFER
jgi:hypothetical protein